MRCRSAIFCEGLRITIPLHRRRRPAASPGERPLPLPPGHSKTFLLASHHLELSRGISFFTNHDFIVPKLRLIIRREVAVWIATINRPIYAEDCRAGGLFAFLRRTRIREAAETLSKKASGVLQSRPRESTFRWRSVARRAAGATRETLTREMSPAPRYGSSANGSGISPTSADCSHSFPRTRLNLD
jgi:hypothetical protein